MASTWGDSWADAWSESWGSLGPEPEVVVEQPQGGRRIPNPWEKKRNERKQEPRTYVPLTAHDREMLFPSKPIVRAPSAPLVVPVMAVKPAPMPVGDDGIDPAVITAILSALDWD